MAMLFLTLILYIGVIVLRFTGGALLGDDKGIPLLAIGILWGVSGMDPCFAAEVLQAPRKLLFSHFFFGKSVGTLKGEGFYYVNPFCSAVNPAAATHLNQSGDVDTGKNGSPTAGAEKNPQAAGKEDIPGRL